MNMTTPFTLPSCTPPRAYTPSRCSCQRCRKDNQCPKLFSDNNMDPGSVPAELKGLSQTEEMLIARCCPIMRVVHLKGGQLLGYGGHVVNVAQDITTFAATLPRLAADVPIIILRREGQDPGQHKDLHVRPNQLQKRVLPALFHLRCPSQSHQRSARGRTRLTTVTSISCRSF